MIAYSLNGLTVTYFDNTSLRGTYTFSLEASRGSLCAELQAMITDGSAINNNYTYEGYIYRIRNGSSRYLGDRLAYELEFRKKSNEKFPIDISSDFLSQIFLISDNTATIAERMRRREIQSTRRSSMSDDGVKGVPSSELWQQNKLVATGTATTIKNRSAKERQRRILSSKKTIGTVAGVVKKIKKTIQPRHQNQPASKLVETRLIKNNQPKRNIVFSDSTPQSNHHSMSPRKKLQPPVHTNLIKGLDKIELR